jgi:hypothetical protein
MELGVMELGGGVLRRWDAAVTLGRVTLLTLHLSTSTRPKPSLISTVHLHLFPSPKLANDNILREFSAIDSQKCFAQQNCVIGGEMWYNIH